MKENTLDLYKVQTSKNKLNRGGSIHLRNAMDDILKDKVAKVPQCVVSTDDGLQARRC